MNIKDYFKQSKYKSKEVIINNIRFQSQKEGNRYLELKMLEKQGLIKDLHIQVKFELQPSYKKNGKIIRAIYYIADFVYFDINKDKVIVEDTKRV